MMAKRDREHVDEDGTDTKVAPAGEVPAGESPEPLDEMDVPPLTEDDDTKGG